MSEGARIAYFSMEIAIDPSMRTYSGGLGILAGDTLRSAADMKVPMVAVTLIHRRGYFEQSLDARGHQSDRPDSWEPSEICEELAPTVTVGIEGRAVTVRAWRHFIEGVGGHRVQVILLDTDVPENGEWDRQLTHFLYGGDSHYRLCQEAILGIGGVRMLRVLGYDKLERYHMNEGHASLLALELLDEHAQGRGAAQFTHEDVQAVHKKCVFTTHTPVPSGHDQFPLSLVERVLDRSELGKMKEVFCCDDVLNMTYLALNLSHYVNGVAKKHGAVSQHMFAKYVIDSITNGVHVGRWVSPPFAELFERHISGWRKDNFNLRYALNLPDEEIWNAHREAKQQLVNYVNRETDANMDTESLTLGFARRATAYKRADLLFFDLDRLRRLSPHGRPLQVILAGKAHPKDLIGQKMIQEVFAAKEKLNGDLRIAYLNNYGMRLAQLLTAGVDVWLNTPVPPLEASGTSGMKAALNGVPSLSILDGWWIEGCIEGITGWAIGELDGEEDAIEDRNARDAEALYSKLEHVVIPIFHEDRERFLTIMRHSIALNGSFFNTQRMLQQYVLRAYFE